MPRSIKTRIPKAKPKEPIYTWGFRSSEPRGGQIIMYETRLEEDGLIRCNCPGWIFCKGSPEEKTCKHKTKIMHEAPDILRRFKAGEVLPRYEADGAASTPEERASTGAPVKKGVADHSKIKYGRMLEL